MQRLSLIVICDEGGHFEKDVRHFASCLKVVDLSFSVLRPQVQMTMRFQPTLQFVDYVEDSLNCGLGIDLQPVSLGVVEPTAKSLG